MVLIAESLTEGIIGCAVEVHKALGPGLLESCYEECLCHALSRKGIAFRRQVDTPVTFDGVKLDCGYRIDLLVDETVIVEVKSVEKLLPIHEAQLLTYMRLGGKKVGLLINFNVMRLANGIVRRVL